MVDREEVLMILAWICGMLTGIVVGGRLFNG